MSTWHVRQEGSPAAVSVPSAGDVLTGLRDGVWLPTDEVKGPADAGWVAIETHPTFEEAALELGPPPPEPADETNLDMNPLIDVCLVLLIFFILTITYASLERAIAVPDSPDEKKGKTDKPLKWDHIKDRVFRVTARMNGEKSVIKLETDVVTTDDLHARMKQLIDRTGRRELLLDIDGDVPWGVQTAILDAAKGNGVINILYRPKPRK